ncbi:hypothetical protein COV16_03875 [Candidatus Woesearchaeota archaeon CG10_big_fil_rev_8_21_14_0_10_34_8]|nr:MAG: hypothetical protein COV16_03875 [Candidatus Woesearchaeota archaeon CG10_big_fil_rev_8_21_14_0_10_34_8]
MRLINYIKQQHSKGFSIDEIREQLLDAGWEQKTVEKYLTQTLVKEKSFEESKEFVELFARYGKFLTQDEEIKFKYNIGMYHVVITTKRLILLRKFPKALIEFNLENIEIVEYYTNVRYYKGIWASAYFIGSVLFYLFQSVLWTRLTMLIPIADKFLQIHPVLNLNLISIIILAYTLSMGIYDLTTFILSFIGRVRVMPKQVGPTDIISSMTPQVEEFIQMMQENMGYKKITLQK